MAYPVGGGLSVAGFVLKKRGFSVKWSEADDDDVLPHRGVALALRYDSSLAKKSRGVIVDMVLGAPAILEEAINRQQARNETVDCMVVDGEVDA